MLAEPAAVALDGPHDGHDRQIGDGRHLGQRLGRDEARHHDRQQVAESLQRNESVPGQEVLVEFGEQVRLGFRVLHRQEGQVERLADRAPEVPIRDQVRLDERLGERGAPVARRLQQLADDLDLHEPLFCKELSETSGIEALGGLDSHEGSGPGLGAPFLSTAAPCDWSALR